MEEVKTLNKWEWCINWTITWTHPDWNSILSS